jgi:hypothetical protein
VNEDNIYPNSMKDLNTGITLYRNHNKAFAGILKKSSENRHIAVTMDFLQEDAK